MKSLLMILVVSLAALGAAGCSTTSSVAQYKASARNVIAIKDHVGTSDKRVKLAEFTAASGVNDSMWCRANGPVSVGSGKTPAQFIYEAMQEELFMAGIYSNNAPVSISGRLEEIKFSSVSPAYWEITLTLTSSNGTSYQTRARHNFDTSWDAFSACRNVADAFPPAVQETLRQAVMDARFRGLL